MKYFARNWNVFAFAFFFLLAALVVAVSPDRAVGLMQTVVEDAEEVGDLARGAYRDISSVNLREAAEEARSFYVAALRMPSLLFERIADQLREVARSKAIHIQAQVSDQFGAWSGATLM